MASETEIRDKCAAIIDSDEQQRIYDIYDGGEIGDTHELWLACTRFRSHIEALEELLNG